MVKFKINSGKLKIKKKITALDKFVLETVGIVSKYAEYAIIGGYVSIFFGRARSTEDVDIFIKKPNFNEFSKMVGEFNSKGFEFHIDDRKSLYFDYLAKRLPINVWRKNFPLLRLEIKIAFKKSQLEAFSNPVTVSFDGKKLTFAQIESQIAYKRYILKSEKDLEDARHLELVFKGISRKLIQRYKKEFEHELQHGK